MTKMTNDKCADAIATAVARIALELPSPPTTADILRALTDAAAAGRANCGHATGPQLL